MQYREYTTNDIDELFSWGSGWEQQFVQLSAGPLDFHSRVVALPDLLFEWNSCGQTVRFREMITEPSLAFGVTLNGGDRVNYRGRELARDEGVVMRSGQEQEYVARKGCRSLFVVIGPALVQSLGWEPSRQRVHRIPLPLIERLVAACQSVTALAMQGEEATADQSMDEAIRDNTLIALRNAMSPWFHGAEPGDGSGDFASREFRLVQHAEQVMARLDPNEKLNISGLAAELDVSQRVLYDAFRHCLGTGPYEFHLLQKMHAFREALVEGEPFHGKIKQLAKAVGFSHLGRLTQAYRRHFGESPRATMKRLKGA